MEYMEMVIPREENEKSNIIMIASQVNVNSHAGDSRNTNINTAFINFDLKGVLPIDKCETIKKTDPR
jgi:hypothetical protein